MFAAAAAVGPQTRPLLLFYGLSQAGRAIAAVATQLRATGTGLQEWKLRGHGIKTVSEMARNGLVEVPVKPEPAGSGMTSSFAGVAKALGSEVIPHGGARLGDLWAAIPEARSVPIEESARYPALATHFEPDVAPRTSEGWFSGSLLHAPAALRGRSEDKARGTAVMEFLSHYPTLDGWELPPTGAAVPVFMESQGGPALTVYWPFAISPDEPISDRVATLYRGGVSYVFPALGDNKRPLHPLMNWWAVLHALSVVARYEPEFWFKTINVDRKDNRTANAVEHLLDVALDAVPELVVNAIYKAAQ
jgi:hypothetical protein